MKEKFKDAPIGTLVRDSSFGEGKIVSTNSTYFANNEYPIEVKFNPGAPHLIYYYTLDGRRFSKDSEPALEFAELAVS